MVSRDLPHLPSHYVPEPLYANQQHHNSHLPAFTSNWQHNLQANHFAQPESFSLGPMQYTSPIMGHVQQPEIPSQIGLLNTSEPYSPAFRETGTHLQPSYSLDQAWDVPPQYGRTTLQDSGTNHSQNGRRTDSIDTTFYGSLPQLTSPNGTSMGTAPSIFGTPAAGSLRELSTTFEVASPTENPDSGRDTDAAHDGRYLTKHEPRAKTNNALGPISVATAVVSGARVEGRSRDGAAAVGASEPVSPDVSQSTAQTPRHGNQYVHSLCGRAFSSRHGVKKHHWGSRVGDINTVTGCWFKHKKPDIEWDAHPSCKDTNLKANTSKPLAKRTPRTETEAPVAPSMIPNRGEPRVAIPTLHELPHMVAESLHQTMPTAPPPSYHTYQMPRQETNGNFDALLTVVNAASTINAPKAQGRVDSVVAHLDAQAAASDSQDHQDSLHTPPSYMRSRNVLPFNPRVYRQIAPAAPGAIVEEDHAGSHVVPAMPDSILGEEHNGPPQSPSPHNQEVDNGERQDHRVLFEDTQVRPNLRGGDDSAEEEWLPGSRKRRRGPRSGISKKELKSLGLDSGADVKKQKSTVNGDRKEGV